MWRLLKESVAELREAPPGQRFGARYHAWRECRRESRLATVLYLSAGIFAVLLGILFSFWPVVPGFVFVLAGLALLSARVGWLAYRLDRLELACRRRIPPRWLGQRQCVREPVMDASRADAGEGAGGANGPGRVAGAAGPGRRTG